MPLKSKCKLINNVYILNIIVRTAINQWRWWNEIIVIKISNSLEEMNVFINKIDEQSVTREIAWLSVQTSS